VQTAGQGGAFVPGASAFGPWGVPAAIETLVITELAPAMGRMAAADGPGH